MPPFNSFNIPFFNKIFSEPLLISICDSIKLLSLIEPFSNITLLVSL